MRQRINRVIGNLKALNRRLMNNSTILFSIVVLCMVAYNMWNYSPVQSEIAHLASGLYHWETGTFNLYNVNPPFVRLFSTLPLYIHNRYRNLELLHTESRRAEFYVGAKFLRDNKDSACLQLRWARFTCLLFLVVLLYSCFDMARQWCKPSSLIALLLCGFNPYIIGHSSTIMPDAHAGACAVLAVLYFKKWLLSDKNVDMLWSGVFLGIAELTKFTLLILYPTYIVLWGLFHIQFSKNMQYTIDNHFIQLFFSLLKLFFVFLISIFVINLGFSFEGTGNKFRDYSFESNTFTVLQQVPPFKNSGAQLIQTISNFPIPLPKNFIKGIDIQCCDFENGLPSYLRGKWSMHGWWYYYLYSLLVKIPLGTLCLFLLALFCTFFLRGYTTCWKSDLFVLLPGISILVFVSLQTGFSSHSRYAIPALPFFFIWISKIGRAFVIGSKCKSYKSSRIVRFLTIALLLWSIGSSLLSYPHSISYFNELAAIIPTSDSRNMPNNINFNRFLSDLMNIGSLNGPRHLLNSNIDWGQDIFLLEKWCKNRPDIKNIKAALWTGFPIDLTMIPTCSEPPLYPEPGWYAISVNRLYGDSGKFLYYKNFYPDAIIGYTIYIYHITEEKLKEVNLQDPI